MISLSIFIEPAVEKPVTLARSTSVSLASNASAAVVEVLELSLKGVMSYNAPLAIA